MLIGKINDYGIVRIERVQYPLLEYIANKTIINKKLLIIRQSQITKKGLRHHRSSNKDLRRDQHPEYEEK